MVDIYWYFTDLPFLPFPTVFNSKDWCEDPWHFHGLGEVFGAPRPYDGMLHVPGLQPGHICGTREDFEQGPAWPPTGEPLVYDEDGIPTCCRRLPVFDVVSGSRPAATVVGPPYSPRTSSSSRPVAQVIHVPTHPFTINTGSRPGSTVEYHGPLLGNVRSGSRPAARISTAPVTLGSAASSSSTDSPVEIAECPVLAPSCATAVPTMVDLECGFFQVAEIPLWRKWILIPGKDYRFVLDFVPGGAGTWTMWAGDGCEGLSVLFAGTEHPPHQEIDFTAPGVVLAWDLGVPTTTGMVGTTKIFRLN